jgi:hypothetical protein
MIIAAIILGMMIIGLIVLMIHISRYSSDDLGIGIFFGIWLIICIVIEIGMIIDITDKPKPTPMDVYQGKTTLEYTIRDGEIIDSVVVFKEN